MNLRGRIARLEQRLPRRPTPAELARQHAVALAQLEQRLRAMAKNLSTTRTTSASGPGDVDGLAHRHPVARTAAEVHEQLLARLRELLGDPPP